MPAPEIASVVSAGRIYTAPPGYLNAATAGLPLPGTRRAIAAFMDDWQAGTLDPAALDTTATALRTAYGRLVGVDAAQVAIGSQASVQISVIAASLPPGARVIVPDGEFSSVGFPFAARGDLQVVSVPLESVPEAVAGGCTAVAFSAVQSANGRLADLDGIRAAAAEVGALSLCDVTQAAGVLPVDAAAFDVTVCHTYKWLCCPRGVSLMTLRPEVSARITPVQAAWYAGADPWSSTYGIDLRLADDARRFDVSPAWMSLAGALPAVEFFASLDGTHGPSVAEVWEHTSGLGSWLCERLGIEVRRQAIISWPDPDGSDLARLRAAGIRVAGRAGGVRASIHLWNTAADIDRLCAALDR